MLIDKLFAHEQPFCLLQFALANSQVKRELRFM